MIFLDNASTTITDTDCADIAKNYMVEEFFNPSAPYHTSVAINEKMNALRRKIVFELKGDGNLIFTSGGTESDNTALLGAKKRKNSQIVVSSSEHPAVMNAALELRRRGYEVAVAPTDNLGRVNAEEFAELVTDCTSLVSIMHVNNETGGINDIKKLCEITKSKNPSVIFHSDGVQAVGKIPVELNSLGVDLYSISGHKFHAPKGVGGLFIKKGVNLKPLILGGGQEGGLRSSTENTACIFAFGNALEKALETQSENYASLRELKYFLENALKEKCLILSDGNTSPFILALSIPYVRGETMLHALEKYEIYIGTGSACGSRKPDKKKNNFNLPKKYENGLLRISFSKYTTRNDLEYFVKCFNLEYDKLLEYTR